MKDEEPRLGGEMMKLAIGFIVLTVLLGSLPMQAGPPIAGTYKSLDGDMLVGRFSESYVGGGQGQIGNTVHAASWTGALLGTEWVISCPVLSEEPDLLWENLDEYGTGQAEYLSTYSGGEFWLSSSGPWGNEDYTGTIDHYEHRTLFIIFMGTPISYTTNVNFTGTFDDYCMCISVLGNGASGGNGAQPPDFPVFLQDDCSEDPGLMGEWGDVADITISIYACASPTESSLWGAIKSLYR